VLAGLVSLRESQVSEAQVLAGAWHILLRNEARVGIHAVLETALTPDAVAWVASSIAVHATACAESLLLLRGVEAGEPLGHHVNIVARIAVCEGSYRLGRVLLLLLLLLARELLLLLEWRLLLLLGRWLGSTGRLCLLILSLHTLSGLEVGLRGIVLSSWHGLWSRYRSRLGLVGSTSTHLDNVCRSVIRHPLCAVGGWELHELLALQGGHHIVCDTHVVEKCWIALVDEMHSRGIHAALEINGAEWKLLVLRDVIVFVSNIVLVVACIDFCESSGDTHNQQEHCELHTVSGHQGAHKVRQQSVNVKS